jgi:hypothetical protein
VREVSDTSVLLGTLGVYALYEEACVGCLNYAWITYGR